METPKERLMRQIEALKRRDFKEVARIGKLIKNELLKKKEEEVLIQAWLYYMAEKKENIYVILMNSIGLVSCSSQC